MSKGDGVVGEEVKVLRESETGDQEAVLEEGEGSS